MFNKKMIHKNYSLTKKLIRSIKIRTWIAAGFIVVLLPVVLLAVYGVFGASGGSNEDPIAIWHFDEGTDNTCRNGTNDVCDASGNGNDGAFGSGSAAPSWMTEDLCVSDKCLYFDGIDDTISVTNTISNVRTVVFWVKTISDTEQFIALNGSTNITVSSGAIIASGFTSPTIYVNGNISSTLTANNHWQHVAITTSTGITANAITIGNVSSNYGNMFMDEIKMFNKQLNSDQVKAEYAGGAGKIKENNEYLNQGLAAYWNLEQTSGNAFDRSGNNITLTNNGSTPYNKGKFGNGVTFNGSTRYFDTTQTISNIQTVSFWANPASASDNYINLSSGVYINSASGSISANGFVDPVYYINGVESSSPTIQTNKWNHILITVKNPITANSFEVGRANSNLAANNSQIDEVRIYSRPLTSYEASRLYNWAPGPVGYWKLDENTGTTAFDSSTNSNNGTLYVPLPVWGQGKYNNSLEFNGGQTVNIGDPQILRFERDMHSSFSVWIKTNANHSGSIISKQTDASSNQGYNIQAGFNYIYFQLVNNYGSDFLEVRPANTLNYYDGNWHHLAFTYDGSSSGSGVKMYWDGKELEIHVVADDLSSNIANNIDLHIGSRNNTEQFFIGRIDDVRIYNYVRTKEQIIEDMNAGHPAGGSPIGSHLAYWKFDEMYGTTAYDDSINSKNLTLSTSSWSSSGKFNGAFKGNGTAYLFRADDDDFDIKEFDDYSISIWFRSNSSSNPTSIEYLFNKASNTNRGYAVYFNTSGEVCFGIDDDNSWGPNVETCSNNDVYDGNWNHVVAVRNKTEGKLQIYLNGLLANSATDTTANSLANSLALYIADRDGAINGNEFNGYLDEIKVFRFALNADQVKIVNNASSALNVSVGQEEADLLTDGSGNRPILWWKLDENQGTSTVYDSSGNERNGSLNNMTAQNWVPGRFGSAIYFRNLQFITRPDESALTPSTITLQAWIKLTALPTALGKTLMITEKDHTTSPFHSYRLEVADYDSNRVYCRFVNQSGGENTASSRSGLVVGVWYLVTCRWDGSNVDLYINGLFDRRSSLTGTSIFDSNGVLSVGTSEGNIFGFLFTGIIDDFKIFNYPRTPSQIMHDFNRGRPIVHYKLDECSGNIAYNSSETRSYSSNNGSIVIGASGTSSVGTCSTSGTAWGNGNLGKRNNSLALDGIDDYIQISDSFYLRFDQSHLNFSLFAWVKRNANGEMNIISKEDASNDGWRLQFNSSNNIMCSVNTINITSSSVITDNNWHHVGCTIDRSGNGQVYINGLPDGPPVPIDSEVMATTSVVRIGTRSYSSTNFLNGQIDDVQIYNYALSPAQVKILFNENSTVRFGPK